MTKAAVVSAAASNPADSTNALIACFVACKSRHADRFAWTTFSTEAGKYASPGATTAPRPAIGNGLACGRRWEAIGFVVFAGRARGKKDADTALAYRKASVEGDSRLESYCPGAAFRVRLAGDRRYGILPGTECWEQDDQNGKNG